MLILKVLKHKLIKAKVIKNNYFYRDKPLFGLDIGSSSIKIMQIDTKSTDQTVLGYGLSTYDSNSVKNGIIVDPETIAKSIYDLFLNKLLGEINTRRVSISLPVAYTYSRILTLPTMRSKDLAEAVKAEASQYIPVPIDELYIDFEITKTTDKDYEMLAVAAPKTIIDSYINVIHLLGLEACVFETTISAASRLITHTEKTNSPTILIDFGSQSADMAVIDKQPIVTGTVTSGGDDFTKYIQEKLKISEDTAKTIKFKYGLGVSKKQNEIIDALDPILSSLSKEISRMIRYYNERNEKQEQIEQIITLGGGANIPGLSEYLTNQLRIPTKMFDPWSRISFGKLNPPNDTEKSMYATAAGLALIKPKDIWK